MESTAVVLVAHGTRDARGAETVRRLAGRIDDALPTQEVVLAYVDVQTPLVDDALDDLMTRHDSVVVVPLLLSRGFHVDVDIANAVAAHHGSRAVAPLGPDPLLAVLLASRLRESGVTPDAHVVLAAAGSTRTEAAEDVEVAVEQLAQEWRGPVAVAHATGTAPSVPDAVAAAREAGASTVAVASYLLADAGADVVTEPLAASADGQDAVLAVVLARLASP